MDDTDDVGQFLEMLEAHTCYVQAEQEHARLAAHGTVSKANLENAAEAETYALRRYYDAFCAAASTARWPR